MSMTTARAAFTNVFAVGLSQPVGVEEKGKDDGDAKRRTHRCKTDVSPGPPSRHQLAPSLHLPARHHAVHTTRQWGRCRTAHSVVHRRGEGAEHARAGSGAAARGCIRRAASMVHACPLMCRPPLAACLPGHVVCAVLPLVSCLELRRMASHPLASTCPLHLAPSHSNPSCSLFSTLSYPQSD